MIGDQLGDFTRQVDPKELKYDRPGCPIRRVHFSVTPGGFRSGGVEQMEEVAVMVFRDAIIRHRTDLLAQETGKLQIG